MILYHGSEKIIDAPEFGKGNSHNDYSRGFYCTKNEELAKERACSNNNNGFANKYEFDMDGLNILYSNSENYNLLNWLAVLTRHRTYWENNTVSEMAKKYLAENFMIDTSGFDVIIGYRADDSYFSFAQDFVAGAISYLQLGEAMRLGKLGEQIVLMSEKAFERIKTLKLGIDNEREIYLLFTTENKRPFVNIYSAYKDHDIMDFALGVYCDDVSDKTKDEDIETEIVNMVMNLVQVGGIQWSEVTD